MRAIRKFLMWIVFDETCTCHIVSRNSDDDAMCYICSPHFRFIPYLLRRLMNEE